jgi:predicted metal-dependent hydrolase
MHSRLEQQMMQIATQVRQSFLRHIVTELSKNQEAWIESAQRQLEDLAEQSLQWTRRNVSLVMKNFGEALLRQAYMEGASPAQVSPAAAAGHETQAALSLTEAPVVTQDCA